MEQTAPDSTQLVETRELLAGGGGGVGSSSGSPNQTGKQSRGSWFAVELTSDAYHGGLIVRLINGRLRVRSRHEHFNGR